MVAKFLREVISGRIHVAPVFAPARIQEIFLGNYLCIGFVPGGTLDPPHIEIMIFCLCCLMWP